MKKLVIVMAVLMMLPFASAGAPVLTESASLRGNGGAAWIGEPAPAINMILDYSVLSYFNGFVERRTVGMDEDLMVSDQGQLGFTIQANKMTMMGTKMVSEQVSIRTAGSAKLSGSLTFGNVMSAMYSGKVNYYTRMWDAAMGKTVTMMKMYPATFSLSYNKATGMTTITGTMRDGSPLGMPFSLTNIPTWSVG